MLLLNMTSNYRIIMPKRKLFLPLSLIPLFDNYFSFLNFERKCKTK